MFSLFRRESYRFLPPPEDLPEPPPLGLVVCVPGLLRAGDVILFFVDFCGLAFEFCFFALFLFGAACILESFTEALGFAQTDLVPCFL